MPAADIDNDSLSILFDDRSFVSWSNETCFPLLLQEFQYLSCCFFVCRIIIPVLFDDLSPAYSRREALHDAFPDTSHFLRHSVGHGYLLPGPVGYLASRVSYRLHLYHAFFCDHFYYAPHLPFCNEHRPRPRKISHEHLIQRSHCLSTHDIKDLKALLIRYHG